jgi:hypothetical protein
MFSRKKKKTYTTKDAAHLEDATIEGELLPAELALEPEELDRLLELLGRNNKERLVLRRKVGSILDVAKGRILWLKPYRLNLREAREMIHELAEERRVKRVEEQKRKKRRYRTEVPPLPPPEQIEYPKKLSPDDIFLSAETAREHLEEADRRRPSAGIDKIRAGLLLRAMELLKSDEAVRFARRIGFLAHQHLNRTPEEREMIEARKREEERLRGEEKGEDDSKTVRTLPKFGKNLTTLAEDAGRVVEENYDSAAKVIRQWVGNGEKTE